MTQDSELLDAGEAGCRREGGLMFRTIEDFEKRWAGEKESSLKVMRALTDASLGQMVAPGGRSLGRIAWHIVQTLGEMGGHAGLKVEGADEKTPQPAHAGAI